jgi:NitT/TauT family transport system substrate-binding protein
MQNRRHFLKTGFSLATASLAGAAALTGARRSVAEEAPPETTSLRLPKTSGFTCLAPLQILDDLLREEGFVNIRYVDFTARAKKKTSPMERRTSDKILSLASPI